MIAIVTLVVTAGLGPLYQQTSDPWQQVRSTELAQSLLHEISARRFDDHSPTGAAGLRCGETVNGNNGPACTTLVSSCASPMPNVESGEAGRNDYDDVDDYHCLSATGDQISNSQDQQLLDVYQGYQVDVRVSATSGLAEETSLKLIAVTVTQPDGSTVEFSRLRGNW